jgi:preprotein translocase subunit SecG
LSKTLEAASKSFTSEGSTQFLSKACFISTSAFFISSFGVSVGIN